jgi:hypothetical protein
LGVHIPWEKKIIATAEPLQPDSEARQQAEKWVERCVSHDVSPTWEIAALTGFFPPSPEGETLLDILVDTEREAEQLMIDKLCDNLSPIKATPLTEEELFAGEIIPYKTEDFRLFVHENTVGVACLGYFSEDKHPYRWLMCLPAISAHVGRPLNRLFVTGVQPPTAEEVVKAAGKNEGLGIKVKINYLELPPQSLEVFRASLAKLMDAAVDEDAPLMPITFAHGVEQRFMGKPARITDSQLRSSEHSRGDSDDARARILIPEQYAFPEMIDSITQLVPSGVRRLTTRDVPKYARVTLAQQLEMIAADKAKKLADEEAAARRKAEKAAAKAAAEEAGEAPPKKTTNPRKKKEDPS